MDIIDLILFLLYCYYSYMISMTKHVIKCLVTDLI